MKKSGTLVNIGGDVRSPLTSCKNVIIPHCCNTLGVFGAGVAKSIVDKWPDAIHEYKDTCNSLKDDSLGEVNYYTVNNNGTRVTIANMIGQLGVRSADNPKPVKYAAIVKCMEDVKEFALKHDSEIHCPKFCSDLAGGNFEFILELIREIWLEAGINVVVYEYGG